MNGNYILIGMPACGKSTVGVILAKTAGKTFIDTDLLIQEKEEMRLQDLIDGKGNDYFQKSEEAVLMALDATNTVISTGGSAVYYPQAMSHLSACGKIIYLKLSLKTIRKRLGNIKTRGITMAADETIGDLYKRRVPLYERYADYVIDGEGKNVEDVVEAILASVES